MNKELGIKDLIGLTIVAVKGYKTPNSKIVSPEFILFNDGETIMDLEEQDYYTYHDCSSYARIITISKNKERYDNIKNNTDTISDSNTNI
jgi:NAD kinase